MKLYLFSLHMPSCHAGRQPYGSYYSNNYNYLLKQVNISWNPYTANIPTVIQHISQRWPPNVSYDIQNENVELITHSGYMLHYILNPWFVSVVGTKVPLYHKTKTIRSLCLAPMPKCSTHKKANITNLFVGTFQNKWQKKG